MSTDPISRSVGKTMGPDRSKVPFEGLAARLGQPGPTWLAVTDRRFLATSVRKWSGFPDQVVATYDKREVARISADRFRLVKIVSVRFSDYSVAKYEARFHSPIEQLNDLLDPATHR